MVGIATAPSRQYLTLDEVAQRLGMSTATVRRRITDGQLRAFRTGKRLIRIRAEDLDQMLREIPSVRGRRWHGQGR